MAPSFQKLPLREGVSEEAAWARLQTPRYVAPAVMVMPAKPPLRGSPALVFRPRCLARHD